MVETTNSPRTVKIALNVEFTAAELEEIMGDLARARAGMEPPVPRSMEGAAMANVGSLIEELPVFTFATLATGGLRIHLRSSGFGWLAFNLTAEQRAGLRDLITDKVADTHRTH